MFLTRAMNRVIVPVLWHDPWMLAGTNLLPKAWMSRVHSTITLTIHQLR